MRLIGAGISAEVASGLGGDRGAIAQGEAVERRLRVAFVESWSITTTTKVELETHKKDAYNPLSQVVAGTSKQLAKLAALRALGIVRHAGLFPRNTVQAVAQLIVANIGKKIKLPCGLQ